MDLLAQILGAATAIIWVGYLVWTLFLRDGEELYRHFSQPKWIDPRIIDDGYQPAKAWHSKR